MAKLKAVLLLLAMLTFGYASQAQNANNSPYSRYGLGDINSPGFASQFGMGGLSVPLGYTDHINVGNPASYTYLKRPVFDFGVQSKTLWLSDESETQASNNVALRNIAFGFPITKRWGMSFGLLPYSSAGYSVSSSDSVAGVNDGAVTTLYTGSGGLNQFYLGNGFNIINKNDSTILGVGVNASYIFGAIDRTRRTIFPDNVGFYNTRVRNSMRLGDVIFDFGLQYQQYLAKDLKFTAGASLFLGSEINGSSDMLSVSYTPTSIAELDVVRDTIEFQDTISGFVFLPQRTAFGVSFEYKERWVIGVEYSTQDWSTYKSSFGGVEETDNLGASTSLIVGLQYRPPLDLSPNAKFWNNIRYRAGFRYGTSYLQLDDSQLTESAFSFGLGIPLSRSFSALNLGMELGQRGTTGNNLLQEQTATFYIGLSLLPQERWFYKRKYD